MSVRVSLWVVLFAAIVFNLALVFLFYQSREVVRQEAISRATQILDKTSLHVESILNRVEVASNMTKWLVERHANNADSIFVYSRGMLVTNPDFYNCSIAFEPYYFKDKGRYFSAYTRYDGDSLLTTQGGSDHYQYFYMDWYLLPMLLEKPAWTEPYIDNDVSMNASEMVTSYCQTFKDKQGKAIGVINTSLSISWLSQTISAIKPYKHSFSIMIGRGGTYFVHPDSTKITRQTIFTEAMEHEDTALVSLGHAMQRGEEGMKQMLISGRNSYVFYKPLGQTGCSMAIVCPENDIFGGFDRLRLSARAIMLVSLLLMLFLIIRIVTHELSPLHKLAKDAETIASGHFDIVMPNLKRIDEIGQLSHSFANMQQSLKKYIDELKSTTSQKASIDRDIRIASSIQMGMLPDNFPTKADRDDVQIYASLTPAKDVGGDLFDFYFRNEKLFFCIGDVSGKGVPASLVMAVARSLFRTLSVHEPHPDRIIAQMNDRMAEDNEQNMFVTFFLGVLDLPTGRLRYSNAGHNSPLLLIEQDNTKQKVFLPCDSNLPIGIMGGWKFTMQETTITAGTTLFLYTDGLTEAEDMEHQQFGEERMINAIPFSTNSQDMTQQVTEAVNAFTGDAEQSDDLTMLTIRYTRRQLNIRYKNEIMLQNDIDQVPQLNEYVDTVCEAMNFDMPTTMQMNLAIEEAVVNVMNYAYPKGTKGDIHILAEANDQRLKFVISDSGMPFDPTTRKEVDTTLSAEERPIGGLGIHLITQLMDSINYERRNNMNVLTLRKKLVAAAPQETNNA